jgi:hypothetical protein
VKYATTEMTSASARLQCQFLINPMQQSKELEVLQQGVAHFEGLLAW